MHKQGVEQRVRRNPTSRDLLIKKQKTDLIIADESHWNSQSFVDSAQSRSIDYEEWNFGSHMERQDAVPMDIPSYIEPEIRHILKPLPR